jgi:DNA-binding NarL/FixJ family response regulator
VRILIAVDHDGMGAVVISKLQSRQDFEICGEASNGEEAVQKALLLRKGTPDFRGGGEAIFPRHHDVENYHVRKPRIPILMMSTRSDEDVVRESKLVGVKGFMSKLGIPHTLLRAVDALLEGQTFF